MSYETKTLTASDDIGYHLPQPAPSAELKITNFTKDSITISHPKLLGKRVTVCLYRKGRVISNVCDKCGEYFSVNKFVSTGMTPFIQIIKCKHVPGDVEVTLKLD